jgi:hypothetical protein
VRRLVRIRTQQLWRMPPDDNIDTDSPYRFALGEVQVISAGSNVALRGPVYASSSLEEGGGANASYRAINSIVRRACRAEDFQAPVCRDCIELVEEKSLVLLR